MVIFRCICLIQGISNFDFELLRNVFFLSQVHFFEILELLKDQCEQLGRWNDETLQEPPSPDLAHSVLASLEQVSLFLSTLMGNYLQNPDV